MRIASVSFQRKFPTKIHRAMSEQKALSIAYGFGSMDDTYGAVGSQVKDFINQGYTPEEALNLSGIGGY